MLKSMGKKKLLTLVAVMAVAVTVMGSFALWDTLSAQSNSTVNLRTPITVTATDFTAMTSTTGLDALPVYTGDAEFTVANTDGKALTLTSTVVIKDKTDVVTDNFIIDAGSPELISASETTKTVKPAIKVTPKDTAAAKALAGKSLTVEVTGTLTETPTAP